MSRKRKSQPSPQRVRPVELSLRQKSILAGILVVAAVFRLQGLTGYFPHFWDEAKYIAEVENLTGNFSVNVGAYAILKLAHLLIGAPYYPQVVAAIFGLLTVFGLYLLGRRLLASTTEAVWLGLLMAAQAAVMPYFVRYSYHVFPVVFAQCFYVYALVAYLVRLQLPRTRTPSDRRRYFLFTVIAMILLAAVPASSFKFILPTVILFVALELFVWWYRSRKIKDKQALPTLIISLVGGLALFFFVPLLLSVISGYAGWFTRATALSQAHAAINTMRLAGHFLFPLHLYHFGGILLIVCAVVGASLLTVGPRGYDHPLFATPFVMIFAFGFAVYLFFFGLFSHLQSGRLYALTVPFVVFASAVGVMHLWFWRKGLGRVLSVVVFGLLCLSLGYKSLADTTRTTNLPAAVAVAAKSLTAGKVFRAEASPQVAYLLYTRFGWDIPYKVRALGDPRDLQFVIDNPPLIMLADGVDLTTSVALDEKYDRGVRDDLETVKENTAMFIYLAETGDLVYAAADDFYTSPAYYLEDIYSWSSYHTLQRRLASARDSIFVYLVNPAKINW